MPQDAHPTRRAVWLLEESLRERQRKQELEHERKLAEIRNGRKVPPMIWTRSEGELIEAILQLHESGVKAADARDAIAQASGHFVRPDGSPVLDISALTADKLRRYGDPRKREIARIKRQNPEFTHKQICLELDRRAEKNKKLQVLPEWQEKTALQKNL